jgi:hypothetical protein
VSDQGFIGENEVRLRVVLGGIQPRKVRSWRSSDRVIRSDSFQLSEGVQSSRLRVPVISEVKRSEEEESSSTCEDFKCDVETLCVLSCSGIGSVSFRETCILPVMKAVARR